MCITPNPLSFPFFRGVMSIFLHSLHAKHTLIFRNSAANTCLGHSFAMTSSQWGWSRGRLLGGKNWPVPSKLGQCLFGRCVCAGFTPPTEAAQHSGMFLACTEGITGQGEGFYPINTAEHMEPPLLSTTL